MISRKNRSIADWIRSLGPSNIMQGVKERSDRIIDFFLAGYFLFGLGLAFYYDTWEIAFGVGGLSLLAYYVTKLMLTDSDAYQYVLSAVLGIFMAQYIYQMHGLFEMHFFAFIGSALLITYQKWKLQIPITVVVLVHHSVFSYLQDVGYGHVYFTQLDYFTVQSFIIHLLLACVIFLISGLLAYHLKKYSELQIKQTSEMERLQTEALLAVNAQKEQLERHVRVLDKAVAQGKFEMASDVMHDIGNAVVGFGSYLTRVRNMQDETQPNTLQHLAEFFKEQKSGVATIIGLAKADAVVEVLTGLGEAQKSNHIEMARSITEQFNIVANIQEILHIQRKYIEGYETQERKLISMRDIINDTLAMLFTPIDKMGIEIYLDVPKDLPRIKGDRTKLVQVMLTILKNSIGAIGSESLEKAIFVTAEVRNGLLSIQVRDTGEGFDKEIEGQLFDRGFTTKSSGSGQSLYNCQTILDSHGGAITLKSEGPGKGSVAFIEFDLVN